MLIYQKWVEWAFQCHLALQFQRKFVKFFTKIKRELSSKLIGQIKKELKIIEKDVAKKFGDLKNPLLLIR